MLKHLIKKAKQNFLLKILVVALIITTIALPVVADDVINVSINGTNRVYSPAPQIISGRTLVPMRAVFEDLGATISWDANTYVVTAIKGDLVISLQIGSNVAYINNTEYSLDVPAQIIDSRTMVPLRFVGEALGANVMWKADTRSVEITTSSSSTTEITMENLVPLYFDLMDFIRTQSLGMNFSTPQAERQRVSQLITASWSQIDTQTKNDLIQIAQASVSIKSQWSSLSEVKKSELKAIWKKIVLSPNWIYAPLENPVSYSNTGVGSFYYPANWTGGETTSGSVGYLFLGENGNTYTWEQVGVSSTSPSGALYALSPITSYEQGKTAMQLARIFSQNLVTAVAPNMKEIDSIETALGSAIILSGNYPGQSEEKFVWIIIIPGNNNYLLCRMSGTIANSDTLVPAFYNMLASLQFSSSSSSSGGSSGSSGSGNGETYNAFDTAWSSLSTAVVSNIWAK